MTFSVFHSEVSLALAGTHSTTVCPPSGTFGAGRGWETLAVVRARVLAGIVGFNRMSRHVELIQDGCKVGRIVFGDDVASAIYLYLWRCWSNSFSGIILKKFSNIRFPSSHYSHIFLTFSRWHWQT